MVAGTVKQWYDEEGWGVLTSPSVGGDVFVHFSHIESSSEYRSLDNGEGVQFEWEPFPEGQDGCFFRATRVVREPR
jgi:CspA family cold shock protein